MSTKQRCDNASLLKQSTSSCDSPIETGAACELILNWYKINSKSLSGEEMLPRLNIQTLMKVLGNPAWNRVYHCWVIQARHMPRLQHFIKHRFDTDKFVYFIEAYNSQGSAPATELAKPAP
ncbi:hypothetical protein MNBD_GAMMA11-3166 [hydrothermal vent metagenome]|uniref:DUF7683 domain-containing protein n=1 Tax=hydrothermal vent metagenome TaxID=652676 RepID=A0A3B0XX90_9ZZZZ